MSRRRVSRNRRSTATLSGNPSQSTRQTPRENATKTCVSRDEKSHAHILMPKPSKKLFKQTPFLVKVLLFLAKFGVNINRPPPPLRAIALFVSAFTLVLLLMFTQRNASFFTLNGEKPDRRAIRCARTFPQVASHQLLTAQPRVTSGGKDALDYLRDGFEVKNYDIGASSRALLSSSFRRFVSFYVLTSRFLLLLDALIVCGCVFPLKYSVDRSSAFVYTSETTCD
jgi:hypothetical protein